jgi:hypothetical protein
MKSIGYIVPHLIHDLWDVCGVNVLKNVNSKNVFLMSMKNVACKIDNRLRNPMVVSILFFDSRREERHRVDCEVHRGWRWRWRFFGVGSDGWSLGAIYLRWSWNRRWMSWQKTEEKPVRLQQRSWDAGTEATSSTEVTSSTEATAIEYDRWAYGTNV